MGIRTILFVFLLMLTKLSFSQKNFNTAKIKDFYFFTPDRNASFEIAYYSAGQVKFEQTEESEYLYNYVDTTRNDSAYSSIITVPRSSFNGCYDSLKQLYSYKDGKLAEGVVFEKTCYKEDNGCIRYDNRNAGEWCLIIKSFFVVNEHNDVIEHKDIYYNESRVDTTLFQNVYEYDAMNRKVKCILYENGKLKQKELFSYTQQQQQVEFYFPQDTTARTVTTFKYADGQLVEKIVDRKYNNTRDIERYAYIAKDRLYSVEYFSGDNNLFKVRKYFY